MLKKIEESRKKIETKEGIFKTTEFIRCGGLKTVKNWLNKQPKDFICVKIMHTTQHEIDEFKKMEKINKTKKGLEK